jgi:heat shock protein 4
MLCFCQLLEEEEVEVPVTKEPAKEPAKMDTDEAPSDAATKGPKEADANMEEAKSAADVSGAENGVPEADKPTQMETDTKVSQPLQFRIV